MTAFSVGLAIPALIRTGADARVKKKATNKRID